MTGWEHPADSAYREAATRPGVRLPSIPGPTLPRLVPVFVATGLATALFLALLVVSFHAFKAEGRAWEPDLHDGDPLIVARILYEEVDFGLLDWLPGYDSSDLRWGSPGRGDVVVFDSPVRDERLVKRVNGMPGDTIDIHGGDVYVNGERLDEPCANTASSRPAKRSSSPRARTSSWATIAWTASIRARAGRCPATRYPARSSSLTCNLRPPRHVPTSVTRPWLAFAIALTLGFAACGEDDDAPTESPAGSATATATADRTSAVTPTPVPSATAEPTTTAVAHPEPIGFPIDPGATLGVVTGQVGSRTLVFDGAGPTAHDYALNAQASDDANTANRSGWNCRTHVEYEGIAALDFYIPTGTPIIATMYGTVTINVISVLNDFDRYGVNREPYIGNPDRARAPLSPFPGPSGGMGVYAVVENDSFVTEYGHLDLDLTDQVVPATAWYGGYATGGDWAAGFSQLSQPRVITPIAQWQVRAGDVIGLSGDSGYSEGPHLHYTVARAAGDRLCPTNELSFDDGGWLFR